MIILSKIRKKMKSSEKTGGFCLSLSCEKCMLVFNFVKDSLSRSKFYILITWKVVNNQILIVHQAEVFHLLILTIAVWSSS